MALAVAPDHLAPTLRTRRLPAALFAIGGPAVEAAWTVAAGQGESGEPGARTRHDAAARAAGVTTGGVHFGSGTREEFVASPPDALLGLAAELRERFAAHVAPAPPAQDLP